MFLLVTESTLVATFALNLSAVMGEELWEDGIEEIPELLCSLSAYLGSARDEPVP